MPEPCPTAITIGNLDGVHLGHRSLVTLTTKLAHEGGLRSAALFFDPHPTVLFGGAQPQDRLTTVRRRRDLLRSLGIDEVIVATFDQAFSEQSPEEFFERVLVTGAGAKEIIVGPYFAFGQKRAGNIDTLRELGEPRGIGVHVVDPVRDGDERISSTMVRHAIRTGDIPTATRLLARLHDVDGRVVHGDHRARTIGFRTANLDCDKVLMPADGVYAVLVQAQSWEHARWGVANLGVRPTFAAGRSVEVHLLDFDEDLYGSELRVGFYARLRAERRFESVDALKSQIAADCAAARGELGDAPAELSRLF